MTVTLSGLSVVLLVAVLALSGCEEAPVTPPKEKAPGLPATLTIADANAEEGDTMTFTVTLHHAVPGGFTATPSFKDGTAIKGTDYTENTRALAFAGTAGEQHSFTVATTEDARWEVNETFTVTLIVTGTTEPVTATDTATGTIIHKPAPDLSAWLYIYSPGSTGIRSIGPNGLIYISATIRNSGDADAPATTVRIYQSDQSADAAITDSATEIWKAAVPALRPGEEWTGDVPGYAIGEESYWQDHGLGGRVMWNVVMIAPSLSKTMFYGLCVDRVQGTPDRGLRNCHVNEVTIDPHTPSYWGRPSPPFLIADSDASAFADLSYVGEYQARVAYSTHSSRSVYGYEARYADQQTISLMVDQGFSRSRADELATFYARRVGQLPARAALDQFMVLVCYEDDGPYQLCQGYAHRSSRKKIAIFYHRERGHGVHPGTLGSFMLHEYAHLAYDVAAYASAQWRAAVAADGRFISKYARDFPYREDVAESYVAWFAVRCSADRLFPAEIAFIRSAIPARVAYFDDLLGGSAGCSVR